MANGTPAPNGFKPPVPQQIQRTQTTILHVFGLELHALPDGGQQLDVVLPDASVLSLPLSADMAKQLGEKLIAPHVDVPRPQVAMN